MAQPWSDDEIALLKQRYDSSYAELVKLFPERSKRALKHKIYALGLKRSQRKRWTDEEYEFIKENPHFTPKECTEHLDRSEVQIAHKMREIRGTARRKFKKGWSDPSEALAYLLGAICADGTVLEYILEMNQTVKDEKFLDRVQLCIEDVLGMPVTRSYYRKCSQNGVCDIYAYLGSYSTEYLKCFGNRDARSVKNIRGPDGEWIHSMEENFPWLKDDPYFWAFIGGLYDGDGTTRRDRVSLAVFAEESAEWVMKQLLDRNFNTVHQDGSVLIRGGRSELKRFLSNIDNELTRKTDIEFPKPEGVQRINRYQAVAFLEAAHYLDGVPAGSYYGYFENGVLTAVSVIGSAQMQKTFGDVRVRELRRFASTSEQLQSSQILSKIIGAYKNDHNDVDVIVTYADPEEGHDGTLYKAMSWMYFGTSLPTIAFYTPDGERISGRYAAQMLQERNIPASECDVKIEQGKHKYAYICATNASKRKRIRKRIGDEMKEYI